MTIPPSQRKERKWHMHRSKVLRLINIQNTTNSLITTFVSSMLHFSLLIRSCPACVLPLFAFFANACEQIVSHKSIISINSSLALSCDRWPDKTFHLETRSSSCKIWSSTSSLLTPPPSKYWGRIPLMRISSCQKKVKVVMLPETGLLC